MPGYSPIEQRESFGPLLLIREPPEGLYSWSFRVFAIVFAVLLYKDVHPRKTCQKRPFPYVIAFVETTHHPEESPTA